MRKTIKSVLAVSVVAGSLSLLPTLVIAEDASVNVRTDSTAQPSDRQNSQVNLPQGATRSQGDANSAKLSGAIGSLTEYAMSKGNFDDVVFYLVDQDRNRLRDYSKQDFADLDGRIDQLNKVWNDKYHGDFKIDADTIFANFPAVEGEIQDPATFVQHWPVPVTEQSSGAQAAGAHEPGNAPPATQPANNVDDDTRTQGNIEKGRNVAIVRIPASHGLPALDVSLIRELQGWRIDIPNNRSAKQIHDDLLTHLTLLGENQVKWPDNADDAKRLFAHHVLMALYGLPATPAHQG